MGLKLRMEHAVFAAASAATIVAGATDKKGIQSFVKPFICLPLGYMAWSRRKELRSELDAMLIAGSLGAATIGDLFMVQSNKDNSLVLGASSFGVMQTGYSAELIRQGARPTLLDLALRAAIYLGSLPLLFQLAPKVCKTFVVYSSMLLFMSALASAPNVSHNAKKFQQWPLPNADPRNWLCVGGTLFVISDSVIALREVAAKSKGMRGVLQTVILFTYAAAQFMLTEGMLQLASKEPEAQ